MYCEKFKDQFAQLAPKCEIPTEAKIILQCVNSNDSMCTHSFQNGRKISFIFSFDKFWYDILASFIRPNTSRTPTSI